MPLRDWNRWQLRVAHRYARMFGGSIREAVELIADRFYAKHSHMRSY